MAKKTTPLLPTTDELLRQFGDRLRLARLRRQLTAKQVAERAGMTPMTLRGLERGGSGVTIGAYLAVMQVLGIEKDLDLLGKADPIGRELQDARLPGRTGALRPALSPSVERTAAGKPSTRPPRAVGVSRVVLERDMPDWIDKGRYTSAEALAGLLKPAASKKKRR